jgi:hypothetical protein
VFGAFSFITNFLEKLLQFLIGQAAFRNRLDERSTDLVKRGSLGDFFLDSLEDKGFHILAALIGALLEFLFEFRRKINHESHTDPPFLREVNIARIPLSRRKLQIDSVAALF